MIWQWSSSERVKLLKAGHFVKRLALCSSLALKSEHYYSTMRRYSHVMDYWVPNKMLTGISSIV